MVDAEKIADLAHVVWAEWMEYLFSVSEDNGDGTITIPGLKVERWKRQMEAEYRDLPESEKKSDREIALRYMKAAIPTGPGWDAPDVMQRRGKFRVSYEFIRDATEGMQYLLGRVLVVRAESRYSTNTIDYEAYSPEFEIVPEALESPHYYAVSSDIEPIAEGNHQGTVITVFGPEFRFEKRLFGVHNV